MNLHDRPLMEQMAVAYATEIERLRELKTPASRQLLNLTKGALDSAETEIARLRAALEIAEKAMHRAISGGKISFRELDAVREALAKEEGNERL